MEKANGKKNHRPILRYAPRTICHPVSSRGALCHRHLPKPQPLRGRRLRRQRCGTEPATTTTAAGNGAATPARRRLHREATLGHTALPAAGRGEGCAAPPPAARSGPGPRRSPPAGRPLTARRRGSLGGPGGSGRRGGGTPAGGDRPVRPPSPPGDRGASVRERGGWAA